MYIIMEFTGLNTDYKRQLYSFKIIKKTHLDIALCKRLFSQIYIIYLFIYLLFYLLF